MKEIRGGSMKKMWVIARPINGISLNGLEYMTDDNNMMYVYKTKEQAYAHLYELGCTDDYIEQSGIIVKEYEVDENEIVVEKT